MSIVAVLRATDVKKTNDVSLAMTAKVSVVKCLLAVRNLNVQRILEN
jgi:hypothetical protein